MQENVPSFASKLKMLRTQSGKTIQEVSDALGISASAISNYERGARIPDAEVLLKTAIYFDCTSDYLLGLSVYKNSEVMQHSSHFSQNISKLISELDYKGKDLFCEDLETLLSLFVNGSPLMYKAELMNLLSESLEVLAITAMAFILTGDIQDSYINDDAIGKDEIDLLKTSIVTLQDLSQKVSKEWAVLFDAPVKLMNSIYVGVSGNESLISDMNEKIAVKKSLRAITNKEEVGDINA